MDAPYRYEAGRVASVVRGRAAQGSPWRLAGTEMVRLPCARMISTRTTDLFDWTVRETGSKGVISARALRHGHP